MENKVLITNCGGAVGFGFKMFDDKGGKIREIKSMTNNYYVDPITMTAYLRSIWGDFELYADKEMLEQIKNGQSMVMRPFRENGKITNHLIGLNTYDLFAEAGYKVKEYYNEYK